MAVVTGARGRRVRRGHRREPLQARADVRASCAAAVGLWCVGGAGRVGGWVAGGAAVWRQAGGRAGGWAFIRGKYEENPHE